MVLFCFGMSVLPLYMSVDQKRTLDALGLALWMVLRYHACMDVGDGNRTSVQPLFEALEGNFNVLH